MSYQKFLHLLYRKIIIEAIICAEFQTISILPITEENYNLLYNIFDFKKMTLEEIIEWYIDIFGDEEPLSTISQLK